MKTFSVAIALVFVAFGLVTVTGAADAPTNPEKLEPQLCDGHAHLHTAKHHAKWSKKLFRSYSIPKWAKEKHRHHVQCPAGPNHKKVMIKRWKKIQRSILPVNHDLWVQIGRCEQPGSGYMGVNWSHTGPTYQGGLGFWYGTWSGFKYPGMPSNAGYATWRQQMKVANRLYRMYGTSPWGCA